MAASIQIRRWTGSGPTKTNITSTTNRANAADDPAPGSNNPIPIPSVGNTNRSYWVSTQLYAASTPDGRINNIRWYTDGSNSLGTGVTMKVATASAYVQATGTPGDSGDDMNGGHGSLNSSILDAFGFTSGSPLSVSGLIDNPDTGDFGDQVVYQVEVDDTAGPGPTGTETITWKYDET